MTTTALTTVPVEVQQPIRWEWRYVAGVGTLIFNACMIVWLVTKGRADSALHKDALDWCFIMSGGILAGLGLGASIEPLAALFQGKPATG